MKHKQILQARLKRQETFLKGVEKQREGLEELSFQGELRMANNISQEIMPQTVTAIKRVHLFKQSTPNMQLLN